ncbi:MAG: ABC transporter ATP-binding protein [Candidatus Omnitrophica bacterium]|nr:ABC transporter ATP-binding protein [Candidatus Omnitrophota bacterium]
MKNYWKLVRFLEEHKGLFGIAILLMFIASFFEGFQLSLLVPMTDRIFNNRAIVVPNNVPQFARHIIDKLNAIPQETMFWSFPIFVLGVLILKNIFSFAHQYVMSDVSQRVMRDVRHKLYEKIQNLSLDYFSQKRTGELISRITNDVGIIENAVSYGLTDLFRQGFLIILYVSIAFSIYWQAAVVIFVVFPLIAWPLTSIGRKLKKLSRSTQEQMADINTHLLETISGIKLVKAFNTEKYEVNRFHGKNYGYYKLKMKTVKRSNIIPAITELFGALCGVFVILWIGRTVMSGHLSFGVFILFFGSLMSVISPVKKIGNVNVMIQQAIAAGDRVYEVLDAEVSVKEKPDAIDLGELHDSIRLDQVDFHYGKAGGMVLKGIDLEVRKGDIVAIVGPTGTGKTTLVNLIPRFYDPAAGRVTIDDVDVRDVTFRSLRDQIGIVSQETILFNDTVRANIAYGARVEPSQAEIEAAAQKAFAHGFIQKMPHGYDTIVGDRGFRLSGGEKQRISIARAVLKNAPVLILDEATSQLDSESEKFVQEALDKLMAGRTVIAIAHRLSTIKKADKIVVLDHGQVVGMGRHEDLLKAGGLYKRLYDMQFQI